MDYRKIPMLRKFLMSAALACGIQCDPSSSDPPALSLVNPEIGARQSYLQFSLGGSKSPDSEKTYTGDTLTLVYQGARDDTFFLSQQICGKNHSPCQREEIALIRKDGALREAQAGNSPLLSGINVFPAGLLSEDFSRPIEFQSYAPVVNKVTVGYSPRFAIRDRVHENVIVLADPSHIPIDVGGHCFILSKERKLLQRWNYHVYGTDGGWEIAD